MKHPNSALLQKLMAAADMGWWSYDSRTRTFTLSETLCVMLGVENTEVPIEEWIQMVREDYQSRLFTQFAAIKGDNSFNEQFPVQTSFGEIWVRIILVEKEYDPQTGILTAVGIVKKIELSKSETSEQLTLESNYDALQKEMRHINQLLHHLPIGYLRLKLLYDKDNRPIDYLFANINRKASQIIGCDSTTLLGKTAREMHIDSVDEQIHLFTHIPPGEHVRNRWTATRTNRTCRCYIYNTPDDNSEIVVLTLDITETVNTHKSLNENENLLQNIVLNIPVGIGIYDRDGRLKKINAKWTEMFGISEPDHVLNQSIYDNPNLPESVKNNIRAGQEMDLSIKYEFKKVKGYYDTSHKGFIDCSTRIRFLYDDQGAISNILVINIDDTRINRTSHRLNQFEDMFHHISSFARVGYACYNLLNKEGYAQGVWYQNYGESPDMPLNEIIGVYKHIHPEDCERMKEALHKFVLGEISSLDQTLRVLHDDGRTTWTRTTLLCKNHDPQKGMVEMIGINYDITELIQARERAEDANRLKSAFLSNMSHEIRTPLNAIVGFSELLASQSGSPEEQEQYMRIIQQNNSLLLQIVSDIIDLAKIEAGTPLPTDELIDLAEVCRETAMIFAPQASEGVRVVTDKQARAYHLHTSRQGVLQVLSNYMNNALKFTHKGEIQVGFCERDTQVELYVEDTGIGIAEQVLPQIFERFVKANHFSQGTGLGLAICKGLAEQLGGRVGVVSTLGVGSRFSIFIPKK